MNLSRGFIVRPISTALVMAAVLIFGWMSYRALPVSDLPNVDFPTIQVSASLPGASPETMASSVATPLERAFASVPGVDSITSSSFLGSTQITLQFNLSRDIDAAAQDVQAAIAEAARRLPDNMPSPPSYRKVNPADSPILMLALTSRTLPPWVLNEYAETVMAQRIAMVPGVGQVNVNGSQKYAVRIQVNPDLLASNGIGIDEVAEAVRRANVNRPTGVLSGPSEAVVVRTNGQLMEAEGYRSVIVAYRNENPVRLDTVARVIDSVENDKTAAWYNAQRSISLSIQKQPGANTVQVVDEVLGLLPTFRAQLPASVQVETVFDRSESIRASVHDVQITLIGTVVLVVLVIFVFLRNWTATFIPSVAIPMSIVGTFGVMYLMDYSLDNLSLMALTLSVGFVVDDAIVVLENIVRHLERGKNPLQAALEGSREIAFTVVSMTISLAAVFIPMLFMGGLVGRLLREFSVTIAVAILLSGVISLTLTPMLCRLMLRGAHEQRHGWLYRLTERGFDGLLAAYAWTLRGALRFSGVVMLGSLAVLGLTVWLFMQVPKGFLPSEDTGRVMVQIEALEGIAFPAMVERLQDVLRVVNRFPEIAGYSASIGQRGGQSASVNTAMIYARLTPREQRAPVDRLIQRLRAACAGIPGVRVFPQNPPAIRIGGRLTRSQYQFTLQSPSIPELHEQTPLLAERIAALPGVQDVSTDLQIRNPEVNVRIDREKAATMGISVEQIEDALGSAFSSREISTIYAANNDYPVILEVDPKFQAEPDRLPLLHVRAAGGQLIPLDALAEITRAVGTMSVNHQGQQPAATISFNLAPGYSLGPAVEQVQRVARETLPATISTSFQGTAAVFQDSLATLPLLLAVAILVIYITLGVLYESLVHPLTILTALPFAGVGALLTLMYFHVDLNLYAFVGVIMLVGLVKKNGIMMVDFAIEAQHRGVPARQAIYDACLVRFRPIMMTTMAALVGTLPIALGWGAGGEARQPLGLSVVGGLVFSQSLTLYVTPVFYLYAERVRPLVDGLFTGRRALDSEAAAPA